MQNHETTFVRNSLLNTRTGVCGSLSDVFQFMDCQSLSSYGNFERRCQLQNKLNLRMRYNWKMKFQIEAINVESMRTTTLNSDYEYNCRQPEKMLSKFHIIARIKLFFCWRRIHKKNSTFTYKNIFYYEDFSEILEVPFEDTT
jgi:hypothetical protein